MAASHENNKWLVYRMEPRKIRKEYLQSWKISAPERFRRVYWLQISKLAWKASDFAFLSNVHDS